VRGESPHPLNVKNVKMRKFKNSWRSQAAKPSETLKNMTKRETIKFIVQMIASIATAIVTALGATSCMGM
jgi:hypothetical protein